MPMYNAADALRAVLALFPEQLNLDKSKSTTSAFEKVIEDAKAILKDYEESPLRYVWLDTGTGQFSNSWSWDEHRAGTREDVLDYWHKVKNDGKSHTHKLIEYRSLTDLEFQFYHIMKLK